MEGVPEAISEDSLVFGREVVISVGGSGLVFLRKGFGVGGLSLVVCVGGLVVMVRLVLLGVD